MDLISATPVTIILFQSLIKIISGIIFWILRSVIKFVHLILLEISITQKWKGAAPIFMIIDIEINMLARFIDLTIVFSINDGIGVTPINKIIEAID